MGPRNRILEHFHDELHVLGVRHRDLNTALVHIGRDVLLNILNNENQCGLGLEKVVPKSIDFKQKQTIVYPVWL